MPDSIKCPKCQKALKGNPALVGKRVRCPGCKQPFLVPEDEDEPEEVDSTSGDDEDAGYQEERPSRRPRRIAEEEDEDERPARRSRREPEEEEEEERPRPKRRRPRRRRDSGSDVTPSNTPLVLGILSIVFCCIPIVGIILGRLAMTKAEQEMARLPGGKRYRGAHKTMATARVLGIIGMCLSLALFLVGVALRVMETVH